MATRLKETEVVVIGLGAAGGVAVLPLAQAGIDVVGLEAGTWLTKRDFAPDEIRNNVRDWPQAVQKCNREVPTHRVNASAPTTRAGGHVDDERGRRHHAPLLGAKLAAQSVGLQGRQRDDTTLRRVARPEGIDRRGLAVRLRRARSRTTTRSSTRLASRVRRATSKATIDPRGNTFEGPRSAPYPMPPLRGTGFTELMASAARRLGWQPFRGPAAINSVRYQDRSPCLYHGFCNRGGCHVDAKNGPNVTTIPRAQKTGHLKVVTRAHVTRINVDDRRSRRGRDLRHRRRRVFPAREDRAACVVHLRELPAAAALDVEGVSQRPVEQSRSGWPTLLLAQHRRVGDGALPVQSEQLVRLAGAGRRGRQLRRRQFRSRGS